VIAALGELRAAGWPAPEDPGSDEDTDLDGRDHLADRLSDEVDWLRQCAGWLRQLDGGRLPAGGQPAPGRRLADRAVVTVDLARVQAVIDRIAADVDDLARAWRAGDLDTAAVLPGRRAERRRRLAEPDLEFRAFCARTGLPASSTLQLERGLGRLAGRAIPARRDRPAARLHWQAVPAHANDHPVPQRTPGQFRELDAVAVLTGPLLPAPHQDRYRAGSSMIRLCSSVVSRSISRVSCVLVLSSSSCSV